MATRTPTQAPPSYTHTPNTVVSVAKELIEKSRSNQDRIAKEVTPETATFDNVIKPLAEDEDEFSNESHIIGFYQYVSVDKDLRDASSEAEKLLDEFSIESGMRQDIFKLVHAVAKNPPSGLAPEAKRLLEKMDLDFVRNGLELGSEQRERLSAIKKELSTMGINFSKALNEESGGLWFTPKELEGVPSDVIEGLKTEGEGEEKKVFLTFKYPDLFPTLKFATNPETRKKVFLANENKLPQNLELFDKTIKLRYEKAKILGYENHAAFALATKMAKDVKTVNKFLTDLRQKLTKGGALEVNKLKQLKKEDVQSRGEKFDGKYFLWDHRFYDRLLVEKEYTIDENKIAEYFPIQKCIQGMLKIFEKLFGLEFIELTDTSAPIGDGTRGWHEDCKVFTVWNEEKAGGDFVGYLYLDLYPREGKYGHAANFGQKPGFLQDATNSSSRHYPATALVCNFSKPTQTKPSLLKHDEVVTFFHELGHGIHDLVARTTYSRYHGTSVVRDFVEAPSQMLENWCWDPTEIRALSFHYQTGEQMPEALVEKLVSTKHVNDALFNLRQLHFGIFDMAVHTITLPEDDGINTSALYNKLRREIAGLDGPEGDDNFGKGQTSFGHLMGGYDAGYYGYLWSQVYSTDMFYAAFKKDPMDPEAGRRYRHQVLEKGGSQDEMETLKGFLGREPTTDAFFEELGFGSVLKQETLSA